AYTKLGSSFRTIHDLDEICDALVREAAEFIGTDAVALWEKDWEGSFVLRSCLGFEKFKGRDIKIPAGKGIVAQVTAKRDAVLIDNVAQEKKYLYPEMIAHSKLKWLLCLPLFFANEVFAVLDVYSRRPHRFFEQEIDYLKALASQAGVAMQNAKLIDHFNRIAESLTSSKDISVILENIARSAMEVLCAEPVVLFQYDQPTKRLLPPPIFTGQLLEPHGYIETFDFTGNSFAELIAAGGESLYVEQSIDGDALMQKVKQFDSANMSKRRFNERENIQSMAALVLKVEEEIVGLMFLNYRTRQQFSSLEKKIMETFALQAAIAIKNSRLIEALRKNEKYLRNIIAGVPDPIIVTENTREQEQPPWRIEVANQAAHEIFGYDSLVGKNARELFGEQKSRVRDALYEAGGEISDFETSFLHRDGHPIPISLSTSILERDASHRIRKTISIGKDLTYRKAIEKQLDHLNRATTALLGMATLDQAYAAVFDNLREIGYNKGMISLVNEEQGLIAAQHAVGEGWIKLVDLTKIDLGSKSILAEVVRTGKPQLIEDCAKDPRCDPFAVDVAEVKAQYVTPLLVKDKVIGALQIDLSDKQDLLKGDKYFLNECLEILAGFSNQIAVAIEADRHRITIDKLRLKLADVGHEFRSPLHIIISQLGGLKYYLEKQYREEEFVKKKIKIIEEEAFRATRQMKNSLFSALGAHAAAGVNLERGLLSEVMTQCVERFYETALKRGIRIIVYDSAKKLPPSYFDKTQMEQIFTNLIDNAVKYSHFNQNIEIKAREFGNKVEIAIMDRGLGIPESHYERIFEGFIRSEVLDSMRYIPGTGLGLMIARNFVQNHKGKIWIKSQPFVKDPHRIQTFDGYETTFFVLLPFNPKEA
ncbi:MAG: GAF domain-containing protein, partial [candidate division KSB1 bacterium]